MAEITQAAEKTLANEGGFFECKATGEVSNFGISARFLRLIGVLHGSGPVSPAEISFIRGISRPQAVSWYLQYFWKPCRIGEIQDQPLADKVFDLAINMGPGPAVSLLQRGINALGRLPALAVDGRMGDRTLAATRSFTASLVLAKLRELAAIRYRDIARNEPAHQADLAGWLKRLEA